MKKIFVLFLFIWSSFTFAKYEDLYKVIVKEENNNLQFIIEKYNSKYTVTNFSNENDAKKYFEDIPLAFKDIDITITDIYEHKILRHTGHFTARAVRTDNQTKKGFIGVFWFNNSVRIISFSNYEEAKNLSKYLDVNKFFSSFNENYLTQKLIQEALVDSL